MQGLHAENEKKNKQNFKHSLYNWFTSPAPKQKAKMFLNLIQEPTPIPFLFPFSFRLGSFQNYYIIPSPLSHTTFFLSPSIPPHTFPGCVGLLLGELHKFIILHLVECIIKYVIFVVGKN